jgi:hypothetical protein
MRTRTRALRASGVAAVTALSILGFSAVASAGAIYCGGGRGPTAELAIQSAMDEPAQHRTMRRVCCARPAA